MEENWTRERQFEYETYKCSRVFNGCTYVILVGVESSDKTDRFHVGVSSGRKRKQQDIFEEKQEKSAGGMEALLWLKNKMMEFPKFYGNRYKKRQYLCIGWADSRRRNIYERLQKEGFEYCIDRGEKILRKRL